MNARAIASRDAERERERRITMAIMYVVLHIEPEKVQFLQSSRNLLIVISSKKKENKRKERKRKRADAKEKERKKLKSEMHTQILNYGVAGLRL